MHKNNDRAFSVPTVFKNNGGIFPISSYEKTEYEMMKHLVEKTKVAGHQLTFKEASVDPDMIQPNEFPRCTYFHSFDEAANAAWTELHPKPTSSGLHLTKAGLKLAGLRGGGITASR